MDFNRWNKILAWAMFATAFIVYAITAQRSVMFWDSGEFIASIYKLEATHPPGAPLYSMLGRIFTLFFPSGSIAYACSLFSALCAAGTIWFLFNAITWLGQKMVTQWEVRDASVTQEKASEVDDTENEEQNDEPQTEKIALQDGSANIAVLAAGVVGSLALIFSDSFWVSSTEAEVYTLSTFFMAAAFWCVTKWESKTQDNRWLVLIAYLLGLSIGVHILNLAVLFPVVMVISMKKLGFNWKSLAIGVGSALVLFVAVNSGMVQGILKVAIKLEVMAVNSWGLGRHSGFFVLAILLAGIFGGGIFWARKNAKPIVEIALLGLTVFTIGWSSYAMAVIRTGVDTPTSNNADDALRLLDYLRSSQFGFSDRPLLYGPTFNSVQDSKTPWLDKEPITVYDEGKGKYVESNDGKLRRPNYDNATKILFPRMYDTSPLNRKGYVDWVSFRGRTVRTSGQQVVIPTMGDNLGFFFAYQLGWLNLRYLMWNYAGRQNDIKGNGVPSKGNWVSGIPFVDNGRIGKANVIPDRYKNNASKNEYYLLPFLLALIGLVFLYEYGKQELVVTGLFFLAFGVAITIFINQLPIHVLIRERDYIFLGAYYAFCIWIGIGVLALFRWVPDVLAGRAKALLVGAICLVLVPGLMAFKGWDDHNRANDNVARNMGIQMLDACEPNGILITSGDNTTFPLWYLQEVEGYRTDVRVLEYNLMGLEWYVKRMQKAMNESDPIKLSLPPGFYQLGRTTVYPFRKNDKLKAHVPVETIIQFLTSMEVGRHMPTDLFQLPVDPSSTGIDSTEAAKYDAVIAPEITWQLNKPSYGLQDIVMFDMLLQNKFERPVYFANTGVNVSYSGLEKYFLNRGLVYEFLPIAPRPGKKWSKLVDIPAMEKLLIDNEDLKVFADTTAFLSSINEEYARNVYRPLFHDLAFAYGEQDKFEECIKVLNHAEETLPNQTVPYKATMFKMATSYYYAEDKEAWRRVTKQVMYNYMDEINWLTSFDPNHPLITYKEATDMGIKLAELMTDIGRTDLDLANELAPRLNEMKAQHADWSQNNRAINKRLNEN